MKIKTFIINMKDDLKRRDYMNIECSKYSDILDYEFVEAVNGKLLSEAYIHQFYDKDKSMNFLKRELNKGEIGCVLSHVKIYEEVVENNLDYALILEDDIVLSDYLYEAINSISNYPASWDIILYGHYSYYIGNKEISSPVSYWRKYKISKNLTLSKLVGFGYGTHGYLVSQKGAKELLKVLYKFYAPMDYYTSNNEQFNVFAMLPTPIKVNVGFDSTINQNSNNNSFIKNNIFIWKVRNFLLSLFCK